jgi:hypothetical protein
MLNEFVGNHSIPGKSIFGFLKRTRIESCFSDSFDVFPSGNVLMGGHRQLQPFGDKRENKRAQSYVHHSRTKIHLNASVFFVCPHLVRPRDIKAEFNF